MELPPTVTYLAFGFSFLVTMLAFVGSGHLWKQSFRRSCVTGAAISGVAGIMLELTNLLHQKKGLTLVVMFVPTVYLTFFLFGRWIFKRLYGTEPYLTSSSSVVGSEPLDLYTSENKYGKERKFNKNRRIMTADFVFSIAHVLGAAFSILFLIYLVKKLND